MKYIKYTVLGFFVAATGAGVYLNQTDLQENQPPVSDHAESSQFKTVAGKQTGQTNSGTIQSLLEQNSTDGEAEPELTKKVLHEDVIKAAKAELFAGRYQNGEFLIIKGKPEKSIIASDADQVKAILVSGGSEYFALREEDDIKIASSNVDDLKNVYYTYQQTYKGIPVEGRLMVVQTDPDDEVSLITGQIETNLNLDLNQLQDATQATQAVILSLADTSVFEPVIHEKPELRIFVDHAVTQPVVTFRSVIEYNDSKGQNHLEEVFVDAKQATLIKAYSLLHSALNREVYSNRYSYCIGTPGIPDSYVLPGTYKFGESGPGYYADNEERSAYNNTGSSYWFYKQVFNRDSYDGNGVRVRNTVHANFMTPQYTCTGNNAQYRPAPYDQLIFGTGDNGPGLSESLDVVGHELTHGVTYHTSALKYENETGAINEAISDIFGAGIEAWQQSGGSQSNNPSTISTNNDTWKVCSACESGLQRYMNNPTADGQSKDYYAERYTGTDDNGGVHLNSGIMNLAFYLLSEGGSHPRNKTSVAVSGIGMNKALRIYYDANVSLFKTLTNTSNAFSNARTLLAQSAETRYGKCSVEWKSVHQSFQAVGVGGSVPACSVTAGSSSTTEPAPEPTDTNKALNARAYVSSYYRYGYEAPRMNDNNSTTQWRSRQITSPYQTEYAALDFGKAISFNKITIDWSGSDYPSYFYIQKLENNYWKTIKTVSKYSTGATTVNVSGSSNMLRIVMKYGAYYRWFAINEIKVN